MNWAYWFDRLVWAVTWATPPVCSRSWICELFMLVTSLPAFIYAVAAEVLAVLSACQACIAELSAAALLLAVIVAVLRELFAVRSASAIAFLELPKESEAPAPVCCCAMDCR